MNPPKPICPESHYVEKLVNGTLNPGDDALVSQHLDHCETCREILEAFDTDEFVVEVKRRLDAEDTIADDLREQLAELSSQTIANVMDSANPANPTSFVSSFDTPSAPEFSSRPDRVFSKGSTPDSNRYADIARWFSKPQDAGDIGQFVGYRICSFCGRGAMGIVFRGIDQQLQRSVAIKFMSPSLLADGQARERFLREARAAASINHRSVVTIHAVHDDCEIPHIVMEYVEGRTLQQRVKRQGRLPTKELIRVARETARGLAAAHAAGVTHRDIKPANILIEKKTGRVIITDFGLARTSTSQTLTASGTVAGTPAFLAPEQIEGKSCDHRADLFSLGSVLYFLASGRLPFPAENIATTLTQIVSSSPKPIGKLVPDLSEWLEELIISLHERNPVDRVQSAEEVVEIIAAFDSGRESRIVRAKKALRSGQALPTRVVGIALASVLVAVVAAFSLGGRTDDDSTADANDNNRNFTADNDRHGDPRDFGEPPFDRHPFDQHPDEEPFLVRFDDHAESFRSLEEAVDRAPDNATIEIHGDGPFICESMDLGRRRLTIVSDPEGARPIIEFDPRHDDENALFIAERELELIGLDLRTGNLHHEDDDDLDEFQLVRFSGERLRISNCRLFNCSDGGCLYAESEHVRIEDSEFFCRNGQPMELECASGTSATIDNSLFVGDEAIVIVADSEISKITLTRCTLAGTHAIVFALANADEEAHFDVEVSECVWLSLSCPILLTSDELISQTSFARYINWHGRKNLWHVAKPNRKIAQQFIEDDEDDERVVQLEWAPARIDDWNRLSNVNEVESQAGNLAISASIDEVVDRIETEASIPRHEFQIRAVDGKPVPWKAGIGDAKSGPNELRDQRIIR